MERNHLFKQILFFCFDFQGRTALHTAADQYRVNPNIFATLTKNSLKPDERDREVKYKIFFSLLMMQILNKLETSC